MTTASAAVAAAAHNGATQAAPKNDPTR